MKIEATPEAPPEANREAARHGLMTELSLPLLHRDSVAEGWRSKAMYIWPGLPNMPETGYIELVGYPFSPRDALACLSDMEAMSAAGVSGVPLQALAAHENRPQAARELEEKDALRRFAATGEEVPEAPEAPPVDTVLLRKAAHNVLLWAWLLEERQREVRDLASSFDANASHLMDALGVEEDVDLAGLHAVDMHLGQDTGLLPSWKLVVQNAALFLPQGCTIVVNDARMAEAVADTYAEHPEYFDDVDANIGEDLGLPPQKGMVWKRAELPLWQMAGLSAPSPQCPWLHRTANILLPVPARAAEKGAA